MKLSPNTRALLTHFNTISTNFLFKPGSEVDTVSVSKEILVKATIPETIPCEFGIYNLGEFLAVMSLFDDPDLEFTPNKVTMTCSSGRGKATYAPSSRSILVVPEYKKPLPTQEDFKFELTADALKQIIKAGSVLDAPDLTITASASEGVTLKVGCNDGKVPNDFELKIKDTSDVSGSYRLRLADMKLMPGTYNVTVLAGIMVRFESTDGRSTTYIALQR